MFSQQGKDGGRKIVHRLPEDLQQVFLAAYKPRALVYSAYL